MCSCEQSIADMQMIRDRWDRRADDGLAVGAHGANYASEQARQITEDIENVIDAHAFCVAS